MEQLKKKQQKINKRMFQKLKRLTEKNKQNN